MKRASEIVSLMQEAREAEIDKQRESEQDLDQASKLKAEEDRLHLAFEAQALNAARKRELHIYWNGEPLNHERLKKQGFMVRDLVLRESFEEHLRRLKNDSNLNIIRTADKLIEKCPGLAMIDGDNLLHRNPIVSLIKTKINTGEINSNTNNELFCAWLRIHSGASKDELERNNKRISQLLEQYKEFLRISQKLKEVADENSMVPENLESATIIDWDDALADENHEKSFSAGRLKWIARYWPSLTDDLESHIETAAKQGRNHEKILVFKWREHWHCLMSSDKNLDGLITDLLSEIEEGENQDDSIFIEFCSPFLAAEELAAHDYIVDVRPVKLMDKTKKPLNDTTKNPQEESNKLDTYLLTISW